MKVNSEIQLYILSRINLEDYDIYVSNIRGLVKEMYGVFMSNKYSEIELNGEKYAFISWLAGLTYVLRVDFETNKQIELMKKWKIKYNEDVPHETFYGIIYENVKELCRL